MIQAIYDDLRSLLAKDHLWKIEGTHWNLKYTQIIIINMHSGCV